MNTDFERLLILLYGLSISPVVFAHGIGPVYFIQELTLLIRLLMVRIAPERLSVYSDAIVTPN